MFQTIFQQPDEESTWAQAREVVDLLEPKFPEDAAYLEESLDEVLAFTAAPKPVWTKVWSNNPHRAAKPGDPPAHRRRWHLPEPRIHHPACRRGPR